LLKDCIGKKEGRQTGRGSGVRKKKKCYRDVLLWKEKTDRKEEEGRQNKEKRQKDAGVESLYYL